MRFSTRSVLNFARNPPILTEGLIALAPGNGRGENSVAQGACSVGKHRKNNDLKGENQRQSEDNHDTAVNETTSHFRFKSMGF